MLPVDVENELKKAEYRLHSRSAGDFTYGAGLLVIGSTDPDIDKFFSQPGIYIKFGTVHVGKDFYKSGYRVVFDSNNLTKADQDEIAHIIGKYDPRPELWFGSDAAAALKSRGFKASLEERTGSRSVWAQQSSKAPEKAESKKDKRKSKSSKKSLKKDKW